MLDDSEETVGKKKDTQAATGKLRNPNPEGGKLKVQGMSKAFVICDHKSDETRSVTLVNKAYLV